MDQNFESFFRLAWPCSACPTTALPATTASTAHCCSFWCLAWFVPAFLLTFFRVPLSFVLFFFLLHVIFFYFTKFFSNWNSRSFDTTVSLCLHCCPPNVAPQPWRPPIALCRPAATPPLPPPPSLPSFSALPPPTPLFPLPNLNLTKSQHFLFQTASSILPISPPAPVSALLHSSRPPTPKTT